MKTYCKALLPAILLLLLIAALPVFADKEAAEAPTATGITKKPCDAELDALLVRIQDFYKNTVDYQAQFVQTTVIPSRGTTEQTSGNVRFKVPGKMRWDYTSPDVRLLLSDGQHVWLYNPEDKQAYKQPYSQAMASKSPIAILSGKADLKKEFHIQIHKRDKETGRLTLKLTPRLAQASTQDMLITIDPVSLTIESLKIDDVYGNTTTIRFSNPIINKGIAEGLFQFSVPEGVTVIETP